MTTSTNSENAVLPIAENQALPRLREIARDIILKRSSVPIDEFGSESDLDALIHALNYSELAISQAAGSLSFSFSTYRNYLASLTMEVEITRRATQSIEETLAFQKAVVSYSVYQLIFSRTDSEYAKPNIDLWRLLYFCSFLEKGLTIPEGLLKAFLDKDQTDSSFALNDLLQLGEFSFLLKTDSEGGVTFNPMVQDTSREVYWPILEEKGLRERRQECLRMKDTLMSSLDKAFEQKKFPLVSTLISHATSWLNYFKQPPNNLLDEQEVLEMQKALASIACHIGDYHSAKVLYESILSMAHTLNRSQQASLQDELAGVLFQLGDYSRAQSLCEAALAEIGKTPNPDPETRLIIAKIQQHLGCLQIVFGQHEQALILLGGALEKLREPPHTVDYLLPALVTQKHLGICLEQMGNYEAALLAFQTTLALEIKTYQTEKHVSIASTQHNLANLLTKMGRFLEAEALYRSALETKAEHYGDTKNIEVARIQQDLAAVLLELDGNKSEIESLLQQALDTTLLFYSKEDCAQVAMIEFNFAKFYLKYGELKKALELIRNCKYIMSRHPEGKQYLPTCDALEKEILDALARKQQTASAVAASSSIYANPEGTVRKKTSAGLQHDQEGDYEAAKACFESAIEILKSGEPSHPKNQKKLAMLEYHLANTCSKLGLLEEAKNHYQTASIFFEQTLGGQELTPKTREKFFEFLIDCRKKTFEPEPESPRESATQCPTG